MFYNTGNFPHRDVFLLCITKDLNSGRVPKHSFNRDSNDKSNKNMLGLLNFTVLAMHELRLQENPFRQDQSSSNLMFNICYILLNQIVLKLLKVR